MTLHNVAAPRPAINLRDIRVGTKVVIYPCFGSGEPVTVTISGFGQKNGRNLIDYAEGGRWAYLDQINEVLVEVTP